MENSIPFTGNLTLPQGCGLASPLQQNNHRKAHHCYSSLNLGTQVSSTIDLVKFISSFHPQNNSVKQKELFSPHGGGNRGSEGLNYLPNVTQLVKGKTSIQNIISGSRAILSFLERRIYKLPSSQADLVVG